MELKRRTRREGGFTLIELISVIIILGILAAVITPRYFDMTTRAQGASYNAALTEATARFNMSYAQYILTTNAVPTTLTNLTGAAYLGVNPDAVDLGDFTVAYVVTAGTPGTPGDPDATPPVPATPATGATVTMTVTPKAGAIPDGVTRIRTINWPG